MFVEFSSLCWKPQKCVNFKVVHDKFCFSEISSCYICSVNKLILFPVHSANSHSCSDFIVSTHCKMLNMHVSVFSIYTDYDIQVLTL